ncbi:TRAFAC clade GTPase domain-containing protein [Sphingobacterium siyangense]|uniref:TRAFAC clade GTPase domain-containing protein n=1 Tax=Sphingobacterium siyangense TaxID=459529 RepID=UPI002FDC8F0F
MRQRCSEGGCDAPKSLCKVHLSPDYQGCEFWRNSVVEQSSTGNRKDEANVIPWSGTELIPSNIELIAHRSSPVIIGLVGAANAGKTSYLGILYTLMFNGSKFKQWNFAGSFTLIAWEAQAKGLKIGTNGKVAFPEATPAQPDYYSLYHLALKKDKQLYDILFADSSGEVFTKWASDTDSSEAENAKWIYENSNGFIFFVDCEALILERGRARNRISQLASQISANLGDRSVIIVWSKADRINEIPSIIKDSVDSLLQQNFADSMQFMISNFSSSSEDQLCYVNNIAACEALLDKLTMVQKLKVRPVLPKSNDFFFNYYGSGSK